MMPRKTDNNWLGLKDACTAVCGVHPRSPDQRLKAYRRIADEALARGFKFRARTYMTDAKKPEQCTFDAALPDDFMEKIGQAADYNSPGIIDFDSDEISLQLWRGPHSVRARAIGVTVCVEDISPLFPQGLGKAAPTNARSVRQPDEARRHELECAALKALYDGALDGCKSANAVAVKLLEITADENGKPLLGKTVVGEFCATFYPKIEWVKHKGD
ncbi:MAG: hypothetical protein ACSHXD_20065 [Marinosulfonomonas sp.]